jgi:hypothetical protein
VKRRSTLLVVAALAVPLLAACTSTPSAQRVAKDVVETLPVSDEVKDCMFEVIDAADADDLQNWADGAAEGDAADTEALSAFEAELADCNG